MKMKTKYFLMLIVACVMGTQVMNAQDTQMSGKKDRKRPTPEQITEMQCRKIVNDLGLDDKTAAKFTDALAPKYEPPTPPIIIIIAVAIIFAMAIMLSPLVSVL